MALTPIIETHTTPSTRPSTKICPWAVANQVRIQILECWGRRPAFLDLSNLSATVDPDRRFAFDRDFYMQASEIGLSLVPVIDLGSTRNRST
jgi:hypothetical protein